MFQPLERQKVVRCLAQRGLDDRCTSCGLQAVESGRKLSYAATEAELLDVCSVSLEVEVREQFRENVVGNVDGPGDSRESVGVWQDLITLYPGDVRLGQVRCRDHVEQGQLVLVADLSETIPDLHLDSLPWPRYASITSSIGKPRAPVNRRSAV